MARAQQQKEQAMPKNTDNLTAGQRAQIAEIEARRAQVKEIARTTPAKED